MKYPDSKTRKMYGKQGLLLDLRRLRFVEDNMPVTDLYGKAYQEVQKRIGIVQGKLAYFK